VSRPVSSAPITYDVVGCGAVVQQYHLPVLDFLRGSGEIAIGGCYDPNVAQARKVAEALGAERWGEVAEPGERDGVDAVLVAAPPGTHGEIARRYVGAGKAAFVEKPFTTTAAEATDLIAAARERGVAMAVNQFWRFYPSVDLARRWLGPHAVSAIAASDGTRMGWAPVSDYVVRDPYGGVVHEFGSHLVDTVLYLMGLDDRTDDAPVEIAEVRKQPPVEPSQECTARLLLGTAGADDLELELTATRLRPVARGFKIRGAFGLLFIPTECAPAPILFQDGDAFRLRGAEAEAQPADLHACFLLAHRDFLGMVREPGSPSRLDAFRFVRLAAILESLHEGGTR
jgi:predicted dehydrogenase